MLNNKTIFIPTLVRIKSGALDRIGIYAQRNYFQNVILLFNKDLDIRIIERANKSLQQNQIKVLEQIGITLASSELAQEIFLSLPPNTKAIIGLGGGKALDVAKYVAFLARLPFIAMPTSLSNDGFCSPQASLEFQGKRRSFPAAMPYGVVIDLDVCLNAPLMLWWSGIGDLVAKITAVHDWKLAFKITGAQIDDFSALLSDATVFQFMAQPERNLESTGLLGTALMLNGIAMEICGSSRPASGSEHLISHALDLICKKPRLHGLQVGMATYIVSQLQKQGTDRIANLFETTDFWEAFRQEPLNKKEWIEAVKMAPSIKSNYYTILSERDCLTEVSNIIDTDKNLFGLFD